MYLMSTCSGLGRAICAKCIDQKASDGMEVRLPCAVQGCGSAPEFILEDRSIACRPFALCEHHLMEYEGVIDSALRLPEQSTSHDTMVEGPLIKPWRPRADGCGDHVQEPEEEWGADCDR